VNLPEGIPAEGPPESLWQRVRATILYIPFRSRLSTWVLLFVVALGVGLYLATALVANKTAAYEILLGGSVFRHDGGFPGVLLGLYGVLIAPAIVALVIAARFEQAVARGIDRAQRRYEGSLDR
jgi:hypothetical protein